LLKLPVDRLPGREVDRQLPPLVLQPGVAT
jgi:hypothetical protein